MVMATGTISVQPLFWLKEQLGEACVEVPLDADQELVLDDPRFAYLTLTDHHQLFCASLLGDQIERGTLKPPPPMGLQRGTRLRPTHGGRREHVAACPAGQFLMANAPVLAPTPRALLLTGVEGTCIWRVPMDALAELAGRPDGDRRVGRLLNGWIRLLLDALPEGTIPPDCREVKPGETVENWRGALRAASDPCWIAPVQPPTHYRGIDVAMLGVPVDCWPLREDTVAICPSGGFRVWSTARLLAVDATASFSRGFASMVIAAVARRNEMAATGRLARDQASALAEQGLLEASLDRLARVGRGERLTHAMVAEGNELSDVVAIIHHDMGMEAPRLERPKLPGLAQVEAALSRSTGARSRPVMLKSGNQDGPRSHWWTSPGGPLLGFIDCGTLTGSRAPRDEAPAGKARLRLTRFADDAPAQEEALRPVAILPRRGGYRLFDPQRPRRGGQAIDAEVAARLHPQAHQFYRALPAKAAGLGLARFLSRGSAGDLLVVGIIGALVGLLGLLIPLVTGLIFDRIVPGAERGLLAQIVLVLLSAYLGGLLFNLAQGFALVRLQTRLDAECEAGVWDRLLRLPLPFFRQYSAGELSSRVDGIARIRESLAGATLTSLLSGIFSLWNLGLLIYLDLRLAVACGALVLVAGLVAAVVSVYQLMGRRRVAELQGKLGGLLFQLMGGIAKLRVANAERRAFGMWANLFARRRSAEVRLAGINTRHSVFAVIYPLVCSGVLFYLLTNQQATAGNPGTGGMSTGQFLAFYSAFGSLLASGLGLLGAVIQVVGIYPQYERARPILIEAPEASGTGAGLGAPPELTGQVELSHLSFRYHKDAPLVLDDVSLRIDPGQFVAIVGPSGSGKSTLLKLLLGLETPGAGNVYYDGQALSSLDVRAVRQQMGVVLQSSGVLAGSIHENIAGTSGATLTETWEAARQAALDRDIRAMPMGMHTVLTQGRSTLSGGQQQRLLIARALARRPKLLFFDEATSALDNETQEQVTRSLDALQVTRVVIAHRLTTIASADHIIVLDRGRIVEQGSYQQLLTAGGRFKSLVDRQVI